MRSLRTLWLVWMIALCGAATAQIPVLPGPGEPAEVPQELANPRATLTTFLRAMEEGNRDLARRTMNLETLSFAVRDTDGRRLARQLLTVLNRIPNVSPERVHADPEGETVTWRVLGPGGGAVGMVEIERQPNGAWLFSSATVQTLPEMWLAVRDLPRVNDFSTPEEAEAEATEQLRDRIPVALQHQFLFLELWQWIALGTLLLGAWLIGVVVGLLFQLILHIYFRLWQDKVAPGSKRGLRRATAWFIATGLWWQVVPYLDLPGPLYAALIFILKVFWTISIAWLVIALFDAVMDAAAARASGIVHRADHILIPFARKFGKTVIIFAAMLIFLASLDINVAGLVAGLGLGGLIIALASKDSVENIFGSLTILFDMPFGIGDYVVIGQAEGIVEEINLRSTRIRTLRDGVITLPNSNLIKASVENLGARRYRQVNATLNIGYANPHHRIEAFSARVRKLVELNPKVRPDKIYVRLHNLGDNAIGLLLQFYFIADSYMEELELREQFVTEVLRIAREEGVLLGAMPWKIPEEAHPNLDPAHHPSA